MQLINTRIISHPLNWLTIMLMLIIGAMAGHLLLSFFDHEPATANGATPEGLSVEQMEPNQTGGFEMGSYASSN